MAMSDLGNALITRGLDARVTSLKTCVILMILSTSSDLMGMPFASLKKGIPSIMRYDFD